MANMASLRVPSLLLRPPPSTPSSGNLLFVEYVEKLVEATLGTEQVLAFFATCFQGHTDSQQALEKGGRQVYRVSVSHVGCVFCSCTAPCLCASCSAHVAHACEQEKESAFASTGCSRSTSTSSTSIPFRL